jgi:hypothetical protein
MHTLLKTSLLCLAISLTISCNVFKKPKEGCPSNGKNVGAEKLLGETKEKIPKARKFRD